MGQVGLKELGYTWNKESPEGRGRECWSYQRSRTKARAVRMPRTLGCSPNPYPSIFLDLESENCFSQNPLQLGFSCKLGPLIT